MMSELTEYGMTTDLFVSRKPHGEAIVVGGAGEQVKWMRVLSRRCAHLLWIQLTQMLFPEKAQIVMALAATTPLRGPEAPTITSDVRTTLVSDGLIEVAGVSGDATVGRAPARRGRPPVVDGARHRAVPGRLGRGARGAPAPVAPGTLSGGSLRAGRADWRTRPFCLSALSGEVRLQDSVECLKVGCNAQF
ncbi:MAG: hypothetical protein M5R40_29835 [Anaerolineae bacterium]|nr:hypothetical protein [Anaerolineae bacterium]